MATVIRRRVLATGRVQGVWFRESCRNEARNRNVTGWVHNRGDGSVEACFEGPAAAVEELVAWCGVGPGRARVDAIEVIDETPVGGVGFHVR